MRGNQPTSALCAKSIEAERQIIGNLALCAHPASAHTQH